MKDKINGKTNAIRVLQHHKIVYQLFPYDTTDNLIDGKSVCQKLNLSYRTFFKTLVTIDKQGDCYVFVIPVDKELDLKKAAKVCGQKKLEMLLSKMLLSTTGYVKGGCSPIAMKKAFPVFIDALDIDLKELVVVSAGKLGLSVQLRLCDLLEVTQASRFCVSN